MNRSDKATEYFRQAALQGHLPALQKLDNLDREGAQEIRQGRAKKLYVDIVGQEPGNLSDGGVLNALGVEYYEGNKLNKDIHEANRYFELSAELGNKYAQYNLGFVYYHGQGFHTRI